MANTNQSSNSQQNVASSKAPIKVNLSSNVESLLSGTKAVLTFSFSDLTTGFSLDDIKVSNGVLTNLVQSTTSPLIFTADFIGGMADRSGMSTIKLDGIYTDLAGTSGTPSNAITIKNIDSPVNVVTQVPTVGFVSNNASVKEGNAGFTDLTFTVKLSASSTETVLVNYSTAQKTYGSATANTDFIAATSNLVFAPGETTKTITIKVAGDTTYESTENFYLDLISAKGATVVTNGAEGSRNSWAMGYIQNDDVAKIPTVGFISNNLSVKEGNSGLTAMNFTVKLSAASTESVEVNYTTELKTYGSAKANSDYVPTTGSIVFAPGETSKVITINAIGDTSYEANENFYLDLKSAIGATIVTNGAEGSRNSWAMGYIQNDDISDKPTVGFISNNASVKEGNSGSTDLIFTAKLSTASTEAVTVNYTTGLKAYGSAKANLDFVPVTDSVVFAPGEISKTIAVKVIGDSIYESTENFYVDLTSAKGATIVINGAEGSRNSWAMGYINNDDVLSVVTVTDKGIFGTTSKDTIGGTAAADVIYGKGGADLISGFAGNDTFVFSKVDVSKLLMDAAQISDFKDGFDMIGLQGLGFGDLRVAQGTGSYASDTVVSTASGETLVVLIGINALSIGAADFTSMV